MTYVTKTARDLARAIGFQPGSIAENAIIGCLSEVVQQCATEAQAAEMYADPEPHETAHARILLLTTEELP